VVKPKDPSPKPKEEKPKPEKPKPQKPIVEKPKVDPKPYINPKQNKRLERPVLQSGNKQVIRDNLKQYI
jgi:hypothetical protein